MNSILSDIVLSYRSLRRSPLAAFAACLALAIGIGSNSMMFSSSKALLLNPLDLPGLEQLVGLRQTDRLGQSGSDLAVTPADFIDWREGQKAFLSLEAHTSWDVSLSGAGEPERLSGVRISPGFFRLLETNPAIGRAFDSGESEADGARVAVASHGFWQRVLGGSSDFRGRRVLLNRQPFTIVGIMPSDFDFPRGTDLWTPLDLKGAEHDRSNHSLAVLGRLADGVSLTQASAAMDDLSRRLENEHPATNQGRRAVLTPLREVVVNSTMQGFMLALFGAGGFVLLIACANVANLQLARASGRTREISIRLALGATRWRISRQLMTEGLLLSLAGGAAGLALAGWGLQAAMDSVPSEITQNIPGWEKQRLDLIVLAFTFALAVASALVFGLAPALQSSRPELSRSLKEGDRSSTGTRSARRLRSLIVVFQIAVSIVLLAGASVMVTGFFGLMRDLDQGYRAEDVLTLRLQLAESRFQEPTEWSRFYDEALRNVASLPSVESAAAVDRAPGEGDRRVMLELQGRPRDEDEPPLQASLKIITPDYLRTLGIPLMSGRDILASDWEERVAAALISRAAAQRFWPGVDPVGQRFRMARRSRLEPAWIEVVGVVGDVKERLDSRPPPPAVYLPFAQQPSPTMDLVIKTSSDPLKAASSIRAALRRIDAHQPIDQVRTLDEVRAGQISGIRISAATMGIQGASALLLTIVGVYSLIAFMAARRRQEMGLRMALGARRIDVMALVVGRSLKLTLAGLALGLPAAALSSRFLQSTLFGVESLQLSLLVGLSALMLLSAILSGCSPARRAAAIDPVEALRSE